MLLNWQKFVYWLIGFILLELLCYIFGGAICLVKKEGCGLQTFPAPCPGVSAGGEGRGTLKPCDRCPDHGLEFPHGIDPLAFREKQPLGLCCSCDQPFRPLHLFTLVLPSLADRVTNPGLIEVIHKVRHLSYPHHVVAAVDFATHASVVD